MNQLTASGRGAETPVSRAPATALNMNDVYPETEHTLFVQLHSILSSASNTGALFEMSTVLGPWIMDPA